MAGRIGVLGGTGNNLLYISEAGSTTADNLYISGIAVQSPLNHFFVSYEAAPGGSFGRGVDVVGGSGSNQMFVVGQLAGSPIGLFGGSGDNAMDVFVTAMSFYDLSANGQGGQTLLSWFDMTGGGIEQSVQTGAHSGRLTISYADGLPSTFLYNDLTVASKL
jgi:hypothetical protein